MPYLPRFGDVAWRWVAYASSTIVIATVAFAFRTPIELKRDVICEVVSPSVLPVPVQGGRVSNLYVHAGQQIKQGQVLLTLLPVAGDTFATTGDVDSVVAPQDGIVALVKAGVGRRLERGDVAVVLDAHPQGPLQIVLRIPSGQRGFVAPGQRVGIKLDAFPYARFGMRTATIASISEVTTGDVDAGGSLHDLGAAKEVGPDYLAWASLGARTFRYGDQEFHIYPGMRGRASIVVERLTLAEWLFAPLLRAARG